MKKCIILLFLLLFQHLCFAQCENDFPFWLEGKWMVHPESLESFEEWKILDDKTMLGITYKKLGNNNLVLDKMYIKCKNQKIIMEVNAIKDNIKSNTEFIFNSDTENVLIFSNKNADFPQEIVYKKINNDTINVNISTKSEQQISMEATLIRKK